MTKLNDKIEKDEDITNSTFKQKLENFWYYYKNYVIIIVFFSVALFSYLYPTIFEPDSDGTISIIAQPFFYDASDYIGEVWSEYAIDLTGDNKTYIKVIPIQSDPNGDFGMDKTMYKAAAMAVDSHIRISENFLLMLDETNYQLLKEQDVIFKDLSSITSNNLEFDNEMYSLKDTNLSKTLNLAVFDIMYFALIDTSNIKTDNLNDKLPLYEKDFKLLEQLIQFG